MPPTEATLGVLALLSDGQPRATVDIFRRLYESQLCRRLADELPPTREEGGRLRPLVGAGLVEPVHDRVGSYFITAAGLQAFREEEAALEAAFPELTARLTAAIEREIGDGRQARMFAESRLANIWRMAADLSADSRRAGRAALLRLALSRRLRALLEKPAAAGHDFMKAVHDQVTDYYYTRLMELVHDEGGERAIALDGLRFAAAAPGLEHAQLSTHSRRGPIFLNVLRIDPAAGRLAVEDVSARPKAERFITAIASRTGAAAVVSAGYFIYSEKGYEPPTRQFDPVGLCIVDGTMTQLPVFRRGCVIVAGDGAVTFRRVGLTDLAVALPDGPQPIDAVNADPDKLTGGALVAYNNVWGRDVAARAGELLLTVVNGVVTSRDQGRALIPLNGFVLRVPAGLTRGVRGLYEEPLPLAFREAVLQQARFAVAAGPMLLEERRFAMNYAGEDFQEGTPPVTFSGDRTIDRNLIPRCGIGTTEGGGVIVAIVDGRQPHLSVGATLVEFATLMRELGCVTALNLDGGGTAAMQVGDLVVSNPSTSVSIDDRGRAAPAASNEGKNVRPLATALLVRPVSAPRRDP